MTQERKNVPVFKNISNVQFTTHVPTIVQFTLQCVPIDAVHSRSNALSEFRQCCWHWWYVNHIFDAPPKKKVIYSKIGRSGGQANNAKSCSAHRPI